MAPMAVRMVAAAQTQELGRWSGRVGWRKQASAVLRPAARHHRTPMVQCDAAAEQEPSVPGTPPDRRLDVAGHSAALRMTSGS